MTGERTGASATAYTRDDKGGLLSMRTGGGSFYYLTDDLGSVVGLTDESGAVVRTYAYAPFGETTSSTGTAGAPENPWRFVGAHNYYTDATGLMKVGIRYYDPKLGRWTQRDPIWNPLDPGQANPYVYVGQNPPRSIDPTGALGWDDVPFVDCEAQAVAAGVATVAIGATFVGVAAAAPATAGAVAVTLIAANASVAATAVSLTVLWPDCD